nr:TNF receptor-associated factor 2-like [Lytechinus pictus]
MGGVEVSYTNESKRLPAVVQESLCPLCTYTFREPFSAKCKHPACKSCLAVFFTRDLPALDRVQCPVCKANLVLDELKSDHTALKRLQKIKSCKCKNCNWKGSYSDYIQNHERNCGGVTRIQCKVLGCGKWLPEKRALDVHRTDEWCPMILIMKARLNHAEIVHLSMRVRSLKKMITNSPDHLSTFIEFE